MELPNIYEGKQVLLNSDRLVFNAREDYILSANETLLFSTNKDFHINTNEDENIGQIIANSPKIYLGVIKEDKKLPDNHAVKYFELRAILEDILSNLELLYSIVLPSLSQITTIEAQATVPNPDNIRSLEGLSELLSDIKSRLDDIKSENVYLK